MFTGPIALLLFLFFGLNPLVAMWSCWRPHPDFIPYMPPFYFETRLEEIVWAPFTTLSLSAIFLQFWFWSALGVEPPPIVFGIPILFFLFGVVYQVAILRYHRYDAVDRMDGVNTPAGGYHFSAVIPSAIIFVVLAIIAFAVGGDEPGFWLVLPFGWLMISSIYYFVMTYRNFAGSVTPFRHVGRASFVAWAIFYLLSFVGVMFSMFSTTGNPLWDAFITLWSWIGLAFGVIIAFIRNVRSQDLETQELEAFYREK